MRNSNTNNKRAKGKFKEKRDYDRNVKSVYDSDPNDWRWYAANEQIVRDSASYSYFYPLGTNVNYGSNASKYMNSGSIPGILAIKCGFSIGKTDSAADAATIAARNIYANVRETNSGAANYEPTDMMMYLLAVDSIFACVAHLRRIYGTIMKYSSTNKYFAEAALAAMGANYNSLVRNINDFRGGLNALISKADTLVLPANLPYMARHQWMYSTIFFDTINNDKAQSYIYTPEFFYKWGYDKDGATCLHGVPFDLSTYSSRVVSPSSTIYGATFDELLDYLEDLIDAISGNNDCDNMRGDILKKYGPNGCIKLQWISEGYQAPVEYSEEVLNQIQNATLLGRSFSPDADIAQNNRWKYDIDPSDWARDYCPVITQDKSVGGGWLIHTPSTFITFVDQSGVQTLARVSEEKREAWINEVYNIKRMVNFIAGPVEAKDTMVATRLTNQAYVYSQAADDTISSDEFGAIIGGLDADEGENYAYMEMFSDTVGSDYAAYAHMYYYAYPNRGENRQYSLIQSDDIYMAIPSYRNVELSTTDSTVAASTWMRTLYANGDDFKRAAMVTCFRRHPFIAQISYGALDLIDGNTDTIIYSIYELSSAGMMLGDINYYTTVDCEDLQLMSMSALLNEFDITQ